MEFKAKQSRKCGSITDFNKQSTFYINPIIFINSKVLLNGFVEMNIKQEALKLILGSAN